MSVEPDEFESPYSTNEEAVAGSAALADSKLPESSDDEDTAGIASAHGGGVGDDGSWSWSWPSDSYSKKRDVARPCLCSAERDGR